MDVSELCINVEDGKPSTSSSSERISLPPMADLHADNNAHIDNRNIVIYPKPEASEHRQRYQLQHQHLKSYTFANSSQTTPSLPSPHQHQQEHPTQNEYFYHQPNNASSSQTSLPSLSGFSSALPTLPTTSTTTAIENNNSNSILIKQLLEQCNTIYTRIGKYRVDPLTESERSNIIDQVYFTAEKMLQSIQQLHSDENQLITPPIQRSTDHPDVTMETGGEPTNNANKAEELDEYKMIRQARNLQDSSVRPKYRRRSKRNVIGQRCHSCNTTETPEWRRGPDGARTLCNACGLHYSKLLRKGSMTVQTHNYLLEGPANYKKAPIIIQYPMIQVNSNNNETASSSSSSSVPTPTQQQPQQQQRPFARPTSHSFSSGSNISRITEIHSDEEMTDTENINYNEDVG